MQTNELTKTSVFDGTRVRKALLNNEWFFSIVDICAVLAESAAPGAYWRKLKQRLVAEGSEVVTFCHGLKLTAPDGKKRETDCANTEGILKLRRDAKDGGAVAGRTRKDIEQQIGSNVASEENFLSNKKKALKSD